MDLVSKILVAVLIVGVLWWAFQPRYVFIVRIQSGRPRVIRGKVTAAFLDAVDDVCTQHHVQSGAVRGVERGRRTSLAFSAGIPKACQQRLRNLWVLQG
jgi:hypothetical protein